MMKEIAELAKKEEGVLIAYDWAGSSNKFDEDKRLWKRCEKEKNIDKMAVLVKKTKWFAAFSGQVKGAVRSAAQEGYSTLMVCIEGGPVSQVEVREMPAIRNQIIADLNRLGVANPAIEIDSLLPSMRLRSWSQPCGQTWAVIH